LRRLPWSAHIPHWKSSLAEHSELSAVVHYHSCFEAEMLVEPLDFQVYWTAAINRCAPRSTTAASQQSLIEYQRHQNDEARLSPSEDWSEARHAGTVEHKIRLRTSGCHGK